MKKVILIVGAVILSVAVLLLVVTLVFFAGFKDFTWNNKGYQYNVNYYKTGLVQPDPTKISENVIIDDSRQIIVYARQSGDTIPTKCNHSLPVTLKSTGQSTLICGISTTDKQTEKTTIVARVMFVKDSNGSIHTLTLQSIPANDLLVSDADLLEIFSSFEVAKGQ